MLWYLSTIGNSADDITNCCGVMSSDTDSSLSSNYSTCSHMDFTKVESDSYFDIITPFNKHFLSNIEDGDAWKQISSIFTYYDMNITVDSSNGGCIYNSNMNCLSDAVFGCVEYVSM